MIINKESLYIDPIMSLENCTFKFYLTGSRFFGGASDDSNYDFFTQDAKDTVGYLKQHGFKLKHAKESTYFGTQGIIGIMSKGNVEVQIVSDVDLRNKIQNKLKSSSMIGPNTTKVRREELWNLAYILANK